MELAQHRWQYSSSEPSIGNNPTTIPPLSRPIEDYQKSLQDLMDAADRASSLFSEVRSVCQRTTSPDTLTAEPLSPHTPSAILSLSRAYQRILPGTLQTVQKLADEAAACRLPKDLLSICNKDIKVVGDSTCHGYNFEERQDYGVWCTYIYLLVLM